MPVKTKKDHVFVFIASIKVQMFNEYEYERDLLYYDMARVRQWWRDLGLGNTFTYILAIALQ